MACNRNYMGYSSEILKERIIVLNRTEAAQNRYGLDAAKTEWTQDVCLHANVEWTKGKMAMNAGALDVYGVIMVRLRWNNIVTMRSRIIWDDKTYQILGDTFHADRQANTIQFHAQLVIND